jgi:hypothetical protein
MVGSVGSLWAVVEDDDDVASGCVDGDLRSAHLSFLSPTFSESYLRRLVASVSVDGDLWFAHLSFSIAHLFRVVSQAPET